MNESTGVSVEEALKQLSESLLVQTILVERFERMTSANPTVFKISQ